LQDVFVDDGATSTSILPSDATRVTRLGPIIQVYGYKNTKYTEQTYYKFITIDGLRTKCCCTVDERVIGLDVIHRYVHHIDYRNANPRSWTARNDLADDEFSSSSNSGSDDSSDD
jgi:hypothetical protein